MNRKLTPEEAEDLHQLAHQPDPWPRVPRELLLTIEWTLVHALDRLEVSRSANQAMLERTI